MREYGRGDTDARWNVIDADSRTVATVAMPAEFEPTDIGADYVLGIWTDALGVEAVRLYHVVGSD